MQLFVSSFDFCLPALGAADSRCLARQIGQPPLPAGQRPGFP
jgi:hypothetical protein